MFDVVLLLVVLDFIGICFFDKTTIYFYLIGLIDHAFVAHYVLWFLLVVVATSTNSVLIVEIVDIGLEMDVREVGVEVLVAMGMMDKHWFTTGCGTL